MSDQDPIIQLTDVAAEHILQIVNKNPKAIGFRLSIKQTGCSGYMYMPAVVEQENPDDIKLVIRQNLVVYVDPEAGDFVKGTTIDFVEKQFGMKQLAYNNPQAQGLCGCGESFTVQDEKND